jgi:RNA-binding protein
MKSNVRNYLRAMAHDLQPIVMVGKEGLSENVVKALDEALACHELVKVKFQANKEDTRDISEDLAKKTKSEVVSVIGFTSVFYKKSEKELIEIPKSLTR